MYVKRTESEPVEQVKEGLLSDILYRCAVVWGHQPHVLNIILCTQPLSKIETLLRTFITCWESKMTG